MEVSYSIVLEVSVRRLNLRYSKDFQRKPSEIYSFEETIYKFQHTSKVDKIKREGATVEMQLFYYEVQIQVQNCSPLPRPPYIMIQCRTYQDLSKH